MENSDAKWYVVRTFSGHENKVKSFIDAELKDNEELRARIIEVLVPMEKVFDWAKQQKNKFWVNPDEGTLHRRLK